ncbi:MAG: M28 family peptidase [Anaerolineaceae bacterium]|nr:M28 family peptidase [Anaerolineaceae bacterium]
MLQEITNLGLSPEIQKSDIAESNEILENILVRINGSTSDEAILIIAHYDTEKGTPGAGDNGSGTAIVLEILNGLSRIDSIKNDIIVLFSDGEELGMLGAKAFVNEHPWMSDVRIAINFDTITIGPAFMWQTSPENGWLVRQYIDAVSQPMANSWLYSLSRLLPLDTDLSPFIESGVSGYNFSTSYLYPEIQTPQDTIEIVNSSSIKHAGIQGEMLIRNLVNMDLSQTQDQDRIFFNLWGAIMIHYPESWAIPLALVSTFLFAVWVGLGIHKHILNYREILKGFSIFILTLFSVILLAVLLWLIGFLIKPAAFAAWIYDPRHSQNDWLFFISLLILIFGSTGLIYQSMLKQTTFPNLITGIFFFWLLIIYICSFSLSGVSYLFVWPLIAVLFSSAFLFNEKEIVAFKSFIKPIWAILFLVPMLVWIPFLLLFFMVTGMGAFPIFVFFMCMFSGIMLPFYFQPENAKNKTYTVNTVLLGLIVFIIGISIS